MPKEKTLKIDKQTIIIICASVLLVVGFLVWDSINKREVELNRGEMEQELKNSEKTQELEDGVNNTETNPITETERIEILVEKQAKEFGIKRCDDFYNDCYYKLITKNPHMNSMESLEYFKEVCRASVEKCKTDLN